jgi:hypothetical protein
MIKEDKRVKIVFILFVLEVIEKIILNTKFKAHAIQQKNTARKR